MSGDATNSRKTQQTSEHQTPLPAPSRTSGKEQPAGKTRRRAKQHMPEPPPPGTGFLWGHDRDGLKGMSRAEQVLAMINTRTWKEVVRPLCEAADEETRGERGPLRGYSAEKLEIAFLYGRTFGKTGADAVRAVLAGDEEPGARELLGFTGGKPRYNQKRMVGVPAVRTLGRHRRRFTKERAAELYQAAFADLVDLYLDDQGNHEACRLLYMDGKTIFTHYTAPRYKKGTKTLVNAPRRDEQGKLIRRDPATGQRAKPVTAPDAGYRPEGQDGHKGGDGWQAVILMNAAGVPLGYQLDKAHTSEKVMSREIVTRYGEEVVPKLQFADPEAVSVLTTDSNFYDRTFKSQLHGLGIASNTQRNKRHLGGQPSEAGAAHTAEYLPINAKPHQKWFCNGHFELACDCGSGQVSKQAHRDHRGHAIMSVEGRCSTCGNVTIQAGRWKRAQNAPKKMRPRIAEWMVRQEEAAEARAAQKAGIPHTPPSAEEHARRVRSAKVPAAAGYMTKMQPGDPPEQAEWSFGNYLTYNDRESRAYGKDRFGHNEGLISALGKRFGVGDEKTWHKLDPAVETDLVQALCLMVALSIVQSAAGRRPGATIHPISSPPTPHSGAPPGLAAAA